MSLEGRGEFSEENKKGYASCRTAGVRERKCVEIVLQFSPPSNNLIERIQKLFFQVSFSFSTAMLLLPFFQQC
jgi:hypothetical protein